MAWLRFILVYILSIPTGILAEELMKRGVVTFAGITFWIISGEVQDRWEVASAFIAGIAAPLFYCLLFTLLLASKRHEASKIRWSLVAIGGVILLAILLETCHEPEWQTAAKICTRFIVYGDTCEKYDQFDSVLACWGQENVADWYPRDRARAIKAIREAGRQRVNAFMDNYKPKECK
jgi:hypothetical protein